MFLAQMDSKHRKEKIIEWQVSKLAEISLVLCNIPGLVSNHITDVDKYLPQDMNPVLTGALSILSHIYDNYQQVLMLLMR